MRRLIAPLLGVALLMRCSIPRDPDHTLAHIDQTHEMVVGAAVCPPQLELDDAGQPTGPEAELAEGFAAVRGASVTWVVAGEEELVKKLEDGELDLVVGGLTTKSPWKSKVGLTRAYAEQIDDHGDRVKRVVAAPLGENALVTALERWFDDGMPR